MSNKKIVVIGAGFGGLASAALLAKKGYDVTLFEKNADTGGRARYYKEGKYKFDMGPSWYLMPEVFEHFFSLFSKSVSDYYKLQKLDPSYRVFFSPGSYEDITPDRVRTGRLFESFEKGGADKISAYLDQAAYKYKIALEQFLYKDYRRLRDFLNKTMLIEGTRLNVFSKLDTFVNKYFSDRRAKQILEYAMVFLGTNPVNAPALYSILSHVDLSQGVFYPSGGLAGVARAIDRLARENGVKISTNSPVEKILMKNGKANGVQVHGEKIGADAVLVNADYAHAELDLLPKEYRTFGEKYWKKRVWAPSMFILYLGVNKTLQGLAHHNLYFKQNWNDHFDQIFKKPAWPEAPNFYLSAISKTDKDSAPRGAENLFALVPVAPGMSDPEEFKKDYAGKIIKHIEAVTGESIASSLDVMRIYSQSDFRNDYNAYGGTALGLSHTLGQTALFRPGMRSRKVANCYFAGQYTHPGVGVPMVLIAAEIAAGIIGSEIG